MAFGRPTSQWIVEEGGRWVFRIILFGWGIIETKAFGMVFKWHES